MATIASIKKQIADLERKATALLKAESAKTIAKVKALIERHGLTAEDLGFGEKSAAKAGGKATKTSKTTKRAAKGRKGASAKTVGVPMYRDAKSGKTWTGRGKPPNWIAGAKDRSKFLIEAAGVAPGIHLAANAPSEGKSRKSKAAGAVRKASSSKTVAKKAARKKPKSAPKSARGATMKAPAKSAKAAKAIPSAPAPKKSAGAKLAKGRKAAPPPPAPALEAAPVTS